MLKVYQNRWRPGRGPGPHRGSSRRSPRPPSRLGRGLAQDPSPDPRPQTPDPTPLGAFGASILAHSALDLGASNPCLPQGLNR